MPPTPLLALSDERPPVTCQSDRRRRSLGLNPPQFQYSFVIAQSATANIREPTENGDGLSLAEVLEIKAIWGMATVSQSHRARADMIESTLDRAKRPALTHSDMATACNANGGGQGAGNPCRIAPI